MEKTRYIDLNRAIISVSGEDASKLIQGMISNDISKVTPSSQIYSYLLTPQGKYIFDFFISLKEGSYIFDIAEQDKESFLKKLSLYKLRSKAEIKDEGENYTVLAVLDNSSGFSDPRHSAMPNRLIMARSELASITLSPIENYHCLRIKNNIPEGADMEKEKSFPLQYRMKELSGVDFKKGCFVGQEVTARTHHRGEIRRTTYSVTAATPLTAGTSIMAADKEVGTILTAIGNSALARIEIASVITAVPLTAGNSPLTILQ